MEDPETGESHVRQRSLTQHVAVEVPAPVEEVPQKTAERVVPKPKSITLAERWELFSHGKNWRRIRPFLRPSRVAVFLAILWCCWLLTDFQIVRDGEAYSQKTKCQHPLILFRDSFVRSHKPIPFLDLQKPDYSLLNEMMLTSTCYLNNYAKNMTCITPLAYGMDHRMVSMKRQNGDIIHLFNPKNPTKMERSVGVPEKNSLLPDLPPAKVMRPLAMTIEYNDVEGAATKRERFELGDAFCISSSLELFDHVLPQLGHVSHTHDENPKK